MDDFFALADKTVFVAGHNGMAGAAVVRRLADERCGILTVDRKDLDLRNQADVRHWLDRARPEVVVVAAGRVGGILANDSYPAKFLYDNLMIAANLIHAAHEVGVQKLLYLGSSCIYPRLADQPITEESLLTGPLEPTNEWYAVAKIAGVKLCQAYRREHGSDFISAMPTNLYGPRDNYDLKSGHVLAALLRKAHEARVARGDHLPVWGSGWPRREFLHVDDLADAVVFLLRNYSEAMPVNVGTGNDVTIRELAETICSTVGFAGALRFDASKPDGAPRKLLDVSKLAEMGWKARTDLPTGLRKTYASFLEETAGNPVARAAR